MQQEATPLVSTGAAVSVGRQHARQTYLLGRGAVHRDVGLADTMGPWLEVKVQLQSTGSELRLTLLHIGTDVCPLAQARVQSGCTAARWR